MREKTFDSHAPTSNVSEMTEMCSHKPPSLEKHLSNSCQIIHPNKQIGSDRSTDCGDDEYLPTSGGRLKFFKNGKFILELSHKREGEKTTWFPVPKKTFWPPESLNFNKQESFNSFSDDTSSVQSNPWQKDRYWKQANPKKSISSKFNFYYRRSSNFRLSNYLKLIIRKRRQPLDASFLNSPAQESTIVPFKSTKKLNGNLPANKSLSIIIDKLSKLLDVSVVSPRKRILRELEKVSLEDKVKRRAPQPSNSILDINTVMASSKQISSYSITSLLADDKPNVDNESGFLRNLLNPNDGLNLKYNPSSVQYHPVANQFEPPLISTSYTSLNQSFYGIPTVSPVSAVYRSPPICWTHCTQPLQCPFPPYVGSLQSNRPSTTSYSSYRYKDNKEHGKNLSSDMPLNLSKNSG